MKKYLVIGNPIEHSLSPQLHNYWIQKYNINGIYEKKKIVDNDLKDLILKVKAKEISGINVTVPFKNKIIPYLDQLTIEANKTQSVNTIYLKGEIVVGHNTDISGFELSIKKTKYDIKDKKILILGAGGVVSSIIQALNNMKVSQIYVCNRTKEKAENLKKLFENLIVVNWGEIPNFDMIINATSLGLKKNDLIDLDLSNIGRDKFFYDVIYNPKQTNFLQTAKKFGHITQNGRMMFIYQAFAAFKIWHQIDPNVDIETIKELKE
tara:strand:- start:1715 stop:2509 length:795 start_codon:yes stop_codon:yes gene_type:complete